MEYIDTLLKLTISLMAIIIVTRLLGKKEMSQVTPLDFVYTLILGGIVDNALYDTTTSLWEILFALAVWGVLIFIVERTTQRFDNWRYLMKGEPSIIISKGKLNAKEMKRNLLEAEQVRTLLRMQGVFSIAEVEYAVLENNGSLSVLEKAGGQPVTREDQGIDYHESEMSYLLIEEASINNGTLKKIDKDEEWLRDGLKEEGYEVEDIYYLEWSEQDGFTIQTYNDSESSRSTTYH
ncbi:DUF421 domain-containing protein [Salimicrobium halophilum]|uniref:Uncharacterized membrane protein YcaP, DUF421 family n=1 Tax=Salimicrobium halophilum TaxID=86666 RepID=A0A1G8T6A7_9BACI|nr:DUF421 domain-containing protein [Salimicrobium halophilum]SDJ37112.1 Uncharacterized membrane protein YcaP, DUF421 family [Salimicrobium halophilum]